MASVLAPPRPKRPQIGVPSGPGGGRGDGGGGGDDFGRGPDPDDSALAVQRYRLGVWVGLGAVVMLFAAFTSAFFVRQGMAIDWRPMAMPSVLWLNTFVILASSFTIERARRGERDRHDSLSWLAATTVLGFLFVAGQLIAWYQLRAAGIFLASNPSSSFFYLLTAAHGLHIAGGILALLYVSLSACRRAFWPRRRAAIEATTIYWHFMDGLWIYLFLLLHFGR